MESHPPEPPRPTATKAGYILALAVALLCARAARAGAQVPPLEPRSAESPTPTEPAHPARAATRYAMITTSTAAATSRWGPFTDGYSLAIAPVVGADLELRRRRTSSWWRLQLAVGPIEHHFQSLDYRPDDHAGWFVHVGAGILGRRCRFDTVCWTAGVTANVGLATEATYGPSVSAMIDLDPELAVELAIGPVVARASVGLAAGVWSSGHGLVGAAAGLGLGTRF